MTLSCVIKVFLLFFLVTFHLQAAVRSSYFLLKNRIEKLESERDELREESKALAKEANKFFGSKDAKQKQLEIDRQITENYDLEIAKLKLELEKLTLKEKVTIWNQTLQKFTKDQRTLSHALSEGLGYITLDCNPMFFKNEIDFYLWNLQKSKSEDDINNRLSFFSQKSDVIKSCINGIIDKRKKIDVDRMFYGCNGNSGNLVKYEILLKNNNININLRVKFEYNGQKSNMGLTKNKVDRVQPCIKKIMANQGINFNLDYVYTDEGKLKDSHATIKIHDILSESNSSNLGILSNRGSPNSDDYLCVLMTHELMHLLGLDDTYSDPRCLERGVGKSNEFMQTMSVSSAFAKLSDQEVKTIIAPLCASKRN